ncbi:MAG: CtsR family transcriptional regulator [Solirubrobacterales bacterium]
MARLSDIIEDFIKDMLQKNQQSQLEIKRNELAIFFGCAPSQINYVLTTRFTVDKGYYIESKRGGGGHILIRRVDINQNKPLAEIINDKIGSSITSDGAYGLLNGLFELNIISERELQIIKIAINDRFLSNGKNRNELRAEILKAVLMVIL